MAVVAGIGGEKVSGEAIIKSFVSMVRCSTGALCWGASKYCRSGSELPCHSSSNDKRSSSIMETGAWTERQPGHVQVSTWCWFVDCDKTHTRQWLHG